jgi:hypothetical protein
LAKFHRGLSGATQVPSVLHAQRTRARSAFVALFFSKSAT